MALMEVARFRTDEPFVRDVINVSDKDLASGVSFLTLARRAGLQVSKYKVDCSIVNEDYIHDGPFEKYNDLGQLDCKGTNKNGKREGPFMAYWTETGQLGAVMMCKDDEFNGPARFFDKRGVLDHETIYVNGVDIFKTKTSAAMNMTQSAMQKQK